MSKATVTTLVNNLSFSQNDTTQTSEYYDEAVKDLAQLPFLTEATIITATDGTATYTLDDSITTVLDMFHDSSVMGRETVQSLQAWTASWRDTVGKPSSYVFEQETAKVFRLVPTPDITSQSFAFALGAGFGTDFPEDSVMVVHTETPQNAQDWLDLPLALDVVAKEFSRESDHRDIQFAQACRELSDFIYKAL